MGHAGHGPFTIQHPDGLADARAFGIRCRVGADGDALPGQFRRAHVHTDTGGAAPGIVHPLQELDPGQGLQADDGPVGQGMLPGKASYAAGSVAAHLGFTAVGIEHAHAQVGTVR